MVKKLKIDLNNKIIIVTGGYGFQVREYVNPFWLMMLLSLFLERIKKNLIPIFKVLKSAFYFV